MNIYYSATWRFFFTFLHVLTHLIILIFRILTKTESFPHRSFLISRSRLYTQFSYIHFKSRYTIRLLCSSCIYSRRVVIYIPSFVDLQKRRRRQWIGRPAMFIAQYNILFYILFLLLQRRVTFQFNVNVPSIRIIVCVGNAIWSIVSVKYFRITFFIFFSVEYVIVQIFFVPKYRLDRC